MLCSTHGQDPFVNDEWVVTESLGVQALEQLRELASLVTREIFTGTPSPFTKHYRAATIWLTARSLTATLTMRDVDTGSDNSSLTIWLRSPACRCRTTLAAPGSPFLPRASLPTSPSNMFTSSPAPSASAHSTLKAAASRVTVRRGSTMWPINPPATISARHYRSGSCLRATRYAGYLHFQDHAGGFVRDYVMNGGDPKAVLAQLARLYRESKGQTPA